MSDATDAIYEDGRHYDRLYGGPATREVAFWVEQARRARGPVLELACGTGKYIVPMLQAGVAAVGIDAAPGMLAEARRKAAAAGVRPELLEGDMRRLDLGRRFALIFIAGNSLCHLLTAADVAECFAGVRRHLAPGGRFGIDVFVPDARLLAREPGVRYPFGAYEDPDGGGDVVITATVRYDPATQVNDVTTFRRDPATGAEHAGSLRMRMFYPQELDLLLAHHGFRIEAKLGDHDGAPFGAASPRQIIVCAADGAPREA